MMTVLWDGIGVFIVFMTVVNKILLIRKNWFNFAELWLFTLLSIPLP